MSHQERILAGGQGVIVVIDHAGYTFTEYQRERNAESIDGLPAVEV